MRKAITVSILLLTTLLFGQEEPLRLQSLTGGEAAISYEMWKAGEDRISEWAFPVSLVMPVNARLQFWTRTAPAFATLASGVSYSLGGLSDILVGGHWLTMSDHLLVHFGMNLPAGRTGLSTEEYSVASVLSRPVFNFNVPEMGQGFDLHLGVNGAIQLGEFTAGAGLSYLLKGGFKPFEDYDGVYDPGDEWSVTLGLERETYIGDTPLKFIGDMLYTSYGTDLWMDGPVYRSGSRLLAQVQAILSLVKMEMIFTVRDRWKAKSTINSGVAFKTQRYHTRGNQFEIEGLGILALNRAVKVRLLLSVQHFSDNDYSIGGALVGGLGGGARLTINEHLMSEATIIFHSGRLNISAGSAGLFGIQIRGGVQYTL